jgi:hypothetical protein
MGDNNPLLPLPPYTRKTPTTDNAYCLKIFIGVLMVLVVLAVCGVAIAALVINANYLVIQRNCVSNESFLGFITTDKNGPSFEWDLQFTIGTPTVNTIHIMGPILPGYNTSSTLFIALCGTPSTLACDLSITFQIKGSVNEYNGAGVNTLINTFREKPNAYYVLVNGGYRMDLGKLC